ncbi:SAE2 domain-containing protein [Favolaschia claudopus]|uniref:SAE2 domain-containing protein n=1 Tax=Favolaschia claudopus TaxID=2862362 RepID=A0AAW0EHH1_9AGAR
MPATAYTGAELRVRDKAIEERHTKELAALEAKNGRLRHALDQRSEEYFHLQNYGERIAGRLGFRTLGEIQMFIDLADEQIQYKDLASRVEGFKEELTVERRNRQALENDLADVTEERDALKVALAKQSAKSSESGASAESLAKELVDLQSRHDEANDRAARADAEFKIRTAKWKAFKQWMQAEEKQYREKRKGFTTAENIRDRDTYYQKRQQKIEDVGFDSSEDEHAEGVAVNEVGVEDKASSPAAAMLPSSPTVVMTADTTPVTKKHPVPPVVTPRTLVVASSTRTPLQLFPVFQRAQGSTAPSSTMQPDDDSVIDLSETQTEEDSQEFPFANNLRDNANTRPPPFTNTPALFSSTERRRPAPYSPVSARPDPAHLGAGEDGKKRRRSEFGTSTANNEDRDKPSPRKVRRFSSPIRKPLNEIRANEPHPSRLRDTPDTRPGRDRDSRGRHTENSPASTPANTSSSKPMADYSAFKGRGRYGKAAASGNDTINASYAIDPAHNEGVNYQFDAVVRRKEHRRRMDGGDCEECRDYYDALGPMPSRLQPPLWRSPQKSHSANTSGKRTCRHGHGHGRDERQDDDEAIQSHKQAISRHRHNWAQGSTPPDYWNIGFPSTQEAQVINERAAEMHQQKLKQVQREAEGGGKYYKTRH